MKKVKIMLLSLALFAVVGGALAFKAKLGNINFCTAPAYWDGGLQQYYCSFGNPDAPTFKKCEDFVLTKEDTRSNAVLKICTTDVGAITTTTQCTTTTCPNTTSLIAD